MRSVLDTVPRLLGERAAAVTEIWGRVGPHRRLAGLLAEVATTKDLLVSRAEAEWRGRELALASTARALEALGTHLRRPRSFDLLREQLHAAAAAFFADHARALTDQVQAKSAPALPMDASGLRSCLPTPPRE